MENKPLDKWHGAHHYSKRVHLFFVSFLFLAAATLFWSYFALSDSRFTYKNSPSPTVNPVAPTPITTCTPRPSCLDTFPRCMIPETEDMCPPTPSPNLKDDRKIFCTQEAKQCSDGSYVGRTGPNCEFTECPTK